MAVRMYDHIDLDVLRQEYESGMSTIALGEKYDCANSTIGDYLRRAGVKMRARGAPVGSGYPRQPIIDAIRSGEKIAAIARRMGISEATIRKIKRDSPAARPE